MLCAGRSFILNVLGCFVAVVVLETMCGIHIDHSLNLMMFSKSSMYIGMGRKKTINRIQQKAIERGVNASAWSESASGTGFLVMSFIFLPKFFGIRILRFV